MRSVRNGQLGWNSRFHFFQQQSFRTEVNLSYAKLPIQQKLWVQCFCAPVSVVKINPTYSNLIADLLHIFIAPRIYVSYNLYLNRRFVRNDHFWSSCSRHAWKRENLASSIFIIVKLSSWLFYHQVPFPVIFRWKTSTGEKISGTSLTLICGGGENDHPSRHEVCVECDLVEHTVPPSQALTRGMKWNLSNNKMTNKLAPRTLQKKLAHSNISHYSGLYNRMWKGQNAWLSTEDGHTDNMARLGPLCQNLDVKSRTRSGKKEEMRLSNEKATQGRKTRNESSKEK